MKAVEWLRPFVETNAWDFIVLWKHGDDPTRFIEWMDCCCSGGCNTEQFMTEEEKGEEYQSETICRDAHFQHPVRTKACEALAKLPLTIPLYSGVHGEVTISKQARWFTQESAGTQVLIPIIGGLVELFTTKIMAKDMKIIDFIAKHFCISLKQEGMYAQMYGFLGLNEHPLAEAYYLQGWPPAPLTSTIHLPSSTQCISNPSIEGSSIGSKPSCEHPSFDSNFVCFTQNESLKPSVKKSSSTKRPKHNETSGKQQRGSGFICGTMEEDIIKLVMKPPREGYLSKNLITERNRRNRIKDGLHTLRAMVPKITKMDKASILGDAIDYIQELQRQVKELQVEIRSLEVDNCEKNTSQLRMPTGKEQGGSGSPPFTERNQSYSGCSRKTPMEVQVEVYQIGKRDFLIKLYCELKPGGFARLMEAINSLGLQIVDANLATSDGKVLHILTVEANELDIQPKKLKEYLMEHTG